MEIAKYSYRSIAAKLSGYVEEIQRVRLINSFAYQDAGRDKANLLFLKQFGVVPQELNNHHGEIEIKELTKLEEYDGLTIFIESICVFDGIPGDIVSGRSKEKNMRKDISTIDAKQVNKAGMYNLLKEGYIKTINKNTHMLARLMETKRKDFRGGYIYLSGFSCTSSNHEENEMSESEFLPWYFELGNMSGMTKMFTQPELDVFLKDLAEQPPLIANLDDYLDGIASNESHS